MGNTSKDRIDWIDAFKGICIIEIVLMHIHYMWEKGIMPEWILLPYFVPAFFFISGAFQKNRSFKEIICQKANTLLVPFFLWYVLALVLKLALLIVNQGATSIHELWINKGYTPFSYQNVDGSLWFLIALFEMCLIGKLFGLLKKSWLILLISLPCAACGMLMMAKILPRPDTYGIIPVAEILWFQVFYILGMLWGKKVLNMIGHEWNKTKFVCFGVALSFVGAVNILPITEYPLNLIPYIGWQAPAACCFIFCTLQFCYWFRRYTPPHSLWIKILRLLFTDCAGYPHAAVQCLLRFYRMGQAYILHHFHADFLLLAHPFLSGSRKVVSCASWSHTNL